MLELVEMRFKGLEKIRKKFILRKLIMKTSEALNWFHQNNFQILICSAHQD